jgi:hypothetical protein
MRRAQSGGGKVDAAGCVQNDVERHTFIGHINGA